MLKIFYFLAFLLNFVNGVWMLLLWIIDTPLVFLPALLLIVLAIPSVRKRLGEIDNGE